MSMHSFFQPARRAACALAVTLAAAMVSPSRADGNDVQGAGASFPSKVYVTWAKRFAEAGGGNVTYKPTGSGDGVAQITARKVHFGGTDTPLSAEELSVRKLVQIPMLIGGIVPVVHLPASVQKPLQLTGEVLADVMLGRIERWDDARIAALNRGVNLPPLRIVRIVRSDRSGTTDGYTRYLAQVSVAFRESVSVSQLPRWPGEVRQAEGTDGVAAAVKNTLGAIGYVSFDRVASDGLIAVMLRNHSGHMVAASEAGFRSAIVNSDLYRRQLDTASLLDMPGLQTWPITQTTFVLMNAEPPVPADVEPALRFLYWCFMRGDDLTRGTGFAPLPTQAQARFAARFDQVVPRSGRRPVYRGF